jgi:hypothetical protein
MSLSLNSLVWVEIKLGDFSELLVILNNFFREILLRGNSSFRHFIIFIYADLELAMASLCDNICRMYFDALWMLNILDWRKWTELDWSGDNCRTLVKPEMNFRVSKYVRNFLTLLEPTDVPMELQVGRSRVRFPMVSLEFFIDIILLAALWGRLRL